MCENGSLFAGRSTERTLVHNVLALESKDYLIVGRLIALSLIYGGPSPHFFSSSVVAYLLNEPLNTSMVNEIADGTLQSLLCKVSISIIITFYHACTCIAVNGCSM